MADAGARVLLIDLDPQAHLTLSVGMEPAEMDKTNYDLFVDEDTTAMEVVREVESIPNLAVLPAETNLAGIESEMAEFTQRRHRAVDPAGQVRRPVQPVRRGAHRLPAGAGAADGQRAVPPRPR